MEHVFISYVREDAQAIDRLCNLLQLAGIDVWIDRQRINPGESWADAIRNAIRTGAFFIVCFSQKYVARYRSYANEELLLAIEELRQRSWAHVWFIPVLLERCEIPELSVGANRRLTDYQWVDLSAGWDTGVARIIGAIKKQQHNRSEPIVNRADTFDPPMLNGAVLQLIQSILTDPMSTHQSITKPLQLLALVVMTAVGEGEDVDPFGVAEWVHKFYPSFAEAYSAIDQLKDIIARVNQDFPELLQDESEDGQNPSLLSLTELVISLDELREHVEDVRGNTVMSSYRALKVREVSRLLDQRVNTWDEPLCRILQTYTTNLNEILLGAMNTAERRLQQDYGSVWRQQAEEIANLPDIYVLIDPQLLWCVLTNMLSNVRFALRPGLKANQMPRIWVGTAKHGGPSEGTNDHVAVRVYSPRIGAFNAPTVGSTFDHQSRSVQRFGGWLSLQEEIAMMRTCAELILPSGERAYEILIWR